MIQKEAVNKAIDYMLAHVGESLSVSQVASHCHFSQYYFERMFKEETGESVYAFLKRQKMDRSAFRLKVERGLSVTEIGYEYGYSPSNYSTAFRQSHKMSPADFRRRIYDRSMEHPFFHIERQSVRSYEEIDSHVIIAELPDRQVLYERRIGNYHDLRYDWCGFLERYAEYITEETLFLERTFDDPSITDAGGCLYDVCMTVNGENLPENVYTIPGGKYAMRRFSGHVSKIYAAYQELFLVWFPGSRRLIDDTRGPFDIYHKTDVDHMRMELTICIPVK